MSAMTLEDVSRAYALQAAKPAAPLRQAQKLCAPCCAIISERPFRYCNAVSLAGETYCPEHSRSFTRSTSKRERPSLKWLADAAMSRLTRE